MGTFKYDFELRRILFGLTAIAKTDPSLLPAIIQQGLPDITKHLALLCDKIVKEKEKQIKYEEEDLEENIVDGKEGDGFEDEDDDEEGGGDSSGDDDADDKEGAKIMAKLKNMREGK